MGFLPDQEGKHGEYLGSCSEVMGSKASSRCQVQGHACWGPSVLFAALSREWIQSHSKVWAQFLVGCTLRVRGKLFEPRCMRRNVKNCVIAILPGWGYSTVSCDTEYPWQESTILSMGFSHPTTESVYPIRFPKHGKSYVRRNRLLSKR